MDHDFNSGSFPQPNPNQISARTPPPRARRILVVDDEAPARILASRVFSEAGFDVVTAKSGFECLEHFRKGANRFDLILLDFSMPFMDGAETFRRMRVIDPGAVVLLSTGFMSQVQSRIERMIAAGLDGVILKPHRPDELLAKVNAILQRVKMSRVGCVASDMATSA